MTVAEAAGDPGRHFPLDLGWQNLVFALRTSAAAVLALALAYWMELSDPGWATLTVYVLAQPTVGAALAKGVWRAVGTVCGGALGLVLVALFSQAAELLVAATVLGVGASFYAGARLRNFAAYGALLGGYTVLLVAYEGSTHPLDAWTIAADRITEILIGISCSTAASLFVLPRYASDVLRAALWRTFSGLSRYVATALNLSTPASVFAGMRRGMVAEVVSFDALRSYTMFEAPELRADEHRLRRTVRQFLVVLAIARGLFFRIDAFDRKGAERVRERLDPVLAATAARIERIARDPTALNDPRRLRRSLMEARLALRTTAAELEDMAGTVPFAPLAGGLLIVRRVSDLLHGLAMVVITEAASLARGHVPDPPRPQADREGKREALLIAVRAGLAILVLSIIWMATGWDEGFTAVSGGAIMLFFGVNQDNPQAGARSYLIWSTVGTIVAYGVMAVVLPWLQGFGALALVLLLVLLPAGLMVGTPRYAWAGIAMGGFTISQLSTGNVFTPDETAYVNGAAALLFGMVVCLAVIAAMPVTSHARRGQSWQRTLGVILPGVARGRMQPRRGAAGIVAMMAGLLPRLAFDRERDDDFLRGTLGAASTAIELGRLVDLAADRAMPEDAARALARFLQRFADALEHLAASRSDRAARLAAAETLVAEATAALSAQTLAPGPAARAVLRAGASLRFIADRFYIDRAYLKRSFAED